MNTTKFDWINVEEKLPTTDVDVVVMDDNGTTMLDHINEQNNWNHNRIVSWMSLDDFVHNLFVL